MSADFMERLGRRTARLLPRQRVVRGFIKVTAATIGIFFAMIAISALLNSNGPQSAETPPASDRKEVPIFAKDYGEAWPFPKFDKGKIRCRTEKVGNEQYSRLRPMALVELGGVEYGLNGAAMGIGGYADHRPLMPQDELGIITPKASRSSREMLETALSLCHPWDVGS